MKLCQIGCGEHARVAHGPSQARCAAERADLVLAGCCDLDAARAESFRRDFGYGRAFTDPAAMLEAERPDAVVVVVPVERTVAVGSLVLERGIPLLLEKPPGETVAEVDRLIAAAERGGRAVPHQVAFNRRFAPLVRELRRRIEEAGPLQHLHYEMTRVERRDPTSRRRPSTASTPSATSPAATTPRRASATARCRSSGAGWRTSSWTR